MYSIVTDMLPSTVVRRPFAASSPESSPPALRIIDPANANTRTLCGFAVLIDT